MVRFDKGQQVAVREAEPLVFLQREGAGVMVVVVVVDHQFLVPAEGVEAPSLGGPEPTSGRCAAGVEKIRDEFPKQSSEGRG